MENTNPNEPTRNRGTHVFFFIVAVLFIIGIVQVLTGNSGAVSAALDDTYLGICGNDGETLFIELDTVTDVQLVDTFDFGTCIDGQTKGSTISGTYSCEAYGEYTVHAYTKVDSCIVVTHSDDILVFNCASDSLTERMYNNLTAAVSAK